MTKKQKKQPHCWMVDCLWLETVSCVTLSLTRKDGAIANDFWCNTAEYITSHTKIDFGLKRLVTTVYGQVRMLWNQWIVIDCSLSHPAGHKPFTCSHQRWARIRTGSDCIF